jgi:hypothetical protein
VSPLRKRRTLMSSPTGLSSTGHTPFTSRCSHCRVHSTTLSDHHVQAASAEVLPLGPRTAAANAATQRRACSIASVQLPAAVDTAAGHKLPTAATPPQH